MSTIPLKFTCLVLLTFLVSTSFSQTNLCDRGTPNATSQRIREKIYQNIKAIKAKKLPDTSVLRAEYMNLQVEFNLLFGQMKDDLRLLTRKRRVCERYSDKLKPLIDTAVAFNDKLLTVLNRGGVASVGITDLLSIFDWIWKKAAEYTERRKNEFYSALQWEDWDKVKN